MEFLEYGELFACPLPDSRRPVGTSVAVLSRKSDPTDQQARQAMSDFAAQAFAAHSPFEFEMVSEASRA